MVAPRDLQSTPKPGYRTMTLSTKDAWPLLKITFSEWSEDKVPQLGAALAFYTALSIAPLLVIVLALVAYVYGDAAAVQKEIDAQMESMVGKQGADALADMVASANKPAQGIVATVLSVITLLFAPQASLASCRVRSIRFGKSSQSLGGASGV